MSMQDSQSVCKKLYQLKDRRICLFNIARMYVKNYTKLKEDFQKQFKKTYPHCFFLISSFLTISPAVSPAISKQNQLIVPYMDQVVKRKKNIIAKKCLKYTSQETGFMMVELKVSQKGKTTARLVATELKNKTFLTCVLSVLNRTQFKKWGETSVTRIYRFFIL